MHKKHAKTCVFVDRAYCAQGPYLKKHIKSRKCYIYAFFMCFLLFFRVFDMFLQGFDYRTSPNTDMYT